MADPAQIVLNALHMIPGLSGGAYEGQPTVPIPSDGKYVRPYAILWSGMGSDVPEERDLSLLADLSVLDWRPQVTIVGASAQVCAAAAKAVNATLTNLPVAGGWLLPNAQLSSQLIPQPDNEATPVRYFMPLQYRLITTTT